MKDLGLASAFFLLGQVSQANVFFEEGVWLVFIFNSFHKASGRLPERSTLAGVRSSDMRSSANILLSLRNMH